MLSIALYDLPTHDICNYRDLTLNFENYASISCSFIDLMSLSKPITYFQKSYPRF